MPRIFHRVSTIDPESNFGISVRFPTKSQRLYYIYYSDEDLVDPAWLLATSNGIPGTGLVEEWVDDGAVTSPHPSMQTQRNYRINVKLPE